MIKMVNSAVLSGARKAIACKTLSLSVHTIQRCYYEKSGQLFEDAPPNAIRPTSTNKLSPEETTLIPKTSNEAGFDNFSPGYIGFESTFYRILKNAGQLADRSLTKSQHQRKKPNVQVAIKPNEV